MSLTARNRRLLTCFAESPAIRDVVGAAGARALADLVTLRNERCRRARRWLMPDIDWEDSFNRTALHEAGHAVVAKYLGATPQLRLTGPGSGETDITIEFPQSTPRVTDFLTHCRGTIAAGGNMAVRVLVGDDEADQELADQVDSVQVDEERMKSLAQDLEQSTGQSAVHWIDEFRKEARQLLEEDFVQRAVLAVAAAVLAATPLYMLNDEQIQNAIESSA